MGTSAQPKLLGGYSGELMAVNSGKLGRPYAIGSSRASSEPVQGPD